VLSISKRGTGGSARAAFSAPEDEASRDLRAAPIALLVGSGAEQVFAKGDRGYRVRRHGTKASYKAPRDAAGAVRSFRVSVAAGSLVVKWSGVPVDYAHPPAIEMTLGAQAYTADFGDPGDGGGGDGGGADLPDGPLPFATSYLGTAMLPSGTVALANARLRSQAELDAYRAQFVAAPAIAAPDFAVSELVVVAGGPVQTPLWPWSVRVTAVGADRGAVTVAYEALFGPTFGPQPRVPSPPAMGVFVHAVSLPRGADSVTFLRTDVESADPWH
jgi:hypothetical protein